MPIDYALYPSNWNEIRKAVLLRAGGGEKPVVGARCERCGVRNYSVGYRNDNGSFCDVREYDVYKVARKEAKRLRNETGEKYITILLEVAHINDPDPMNCAMDNLSALCQRCHHVNDLLLKQKHERLRKRRKLIASGQLTINF